MKHLLKYKNSILFIVIILFAFQSGILAQANCATELFPNQVIYNNETRDARNAVDIDVLGDVIQVPLVAHILTDYNLSNGLSKSDLLAAVQDLNQAFEVASFHFNLCHINYISNDDLGIIKYSRRGHSNEFAMAAKTAYQSALNVYFVPEAHGLNNQPVCGWSSYPADLKAFDKYWIVINNICANNESTLTHEVGHYFNLYHTHQGASSSLQIDDIELIDETNCGPNIGDELCDTPAEPYREGLGLSATINKDCNFICDYFDPNGHGYDPDNGFGFNYMSYAPSECRVYFSPGQIKRMKISYLLDRTYLSEFCPNAKIQSTAVKDSLFLLELYEATNGVNWNPLQWNLEEPVSSWEGVELNVFGMVNKIELPNNNLRGELPIEIGNFPYLEILTLSDNQINGILPFNLGNLKWLKKLDLSNNDLHGQIPAELGYLYRLNELKLNHNELSNSVPSKLGNLTNLTNLNLMHNNLSGCYNDNLADLCDVLLTQVSQGNNFSYDWSEFCEQGTNRCGCDRKTDSLTLLSLYAATQGDRWQTPWNLTESIGNWHGITLNDLGCVNKINLSNNQLMGELPQEIRELQYLDTLILSNNTICGKIPTHIGNLSKLKVLDLSANIISGSIPVEVGDLQKLEVLRLNANQFCGYIPYEIGDLKNLSEMFLADNRFSKCYHSKLIALIEEDGEVLNDFYDIAINNRCTNCHIDDWTAMKSIYESTNAKVSYSDEGLFSGITPPDNCSLTTLESVYLNDYGRVKDILWKDAGLTGSIPANINLLTDLESLNLGGNNLSGSLPPTIGELNNLFYLRLSGNPDLEECFPTEMLCLCGQANVFFGDGNGKLFLGNGNATILDSIFNPLENSTLKFKLFCSNVSYNCDGNDADLIYPGDFNRDGIVNHFDLLNWAIAYGNEGQKRTNPTNEWMPQVCEDWDDEANGINYKHQDANGDGHINQEDLEVMSLNYNESIKPDDDPSVPTVDNATGFRLSLQPSNSYRNTFNLYLHSDDQTINSINLQGLAFILDLGELPIEHIHFVFPDNKQPIAESVEEVLGAFQIGFAFDNMVQIPVNQTKTEEDPFGRIIIVVDADSPIDDTISMKINTGIFLDGADNLLISEVTSLDHYFDNSEDINAIDCKDKEISAYFGSDQKLYAETFIKSPRSKNEYTTIDVCSNVEFKPGGYVELKPGFYAEYGSTFLAVNRECFGNLANRNNRVDHFANQTSIYPNPANTQTTIAFNLQNAATVSLNITDMTGKQITNLLNQVNKEQGIHNIPYNTSQLPTGVYYCTLKHNEMVNTQKLIVVR